MKATAFQNPLPASLVTATLMMVCQILFLLPARAADPVTEPIARLRADREKAISDAISKANTEYSNSLDKLKSLHGSNPEAAAIIVREKAELDKVAVVILPPVVRLQTAIAASAPAVKRERPAVSNADDLIRYLVGTRWNYYDNDKFLGTPKVLELTGPETAILDGKPKQWKALDKTKFWLEGNREFRFNKNYDEFSGGWVPNPKDRNTARILP